MGMKANRKFVEEDSGVSAVIGVILMLAITVAIAATVYVYVGGMLPGGSGLTPTFKLQIDESNDRLEVLSADSTADWNRLAIKTSSSNVKFNLNVEVSGTAGTTLTADTATEITSSSDPMGATEYIDFEGVGGDLSDVIIIIIDTTSNQQIGDYTFLTIEQVNPL